MGNDEDKVWVSISHTINIGNYENYKIEFGQSQTILKDNDPITMRINIAKQIVKEINGLSNKLKQQQ